MRKLVTEKPSYTAQTNSAHPFPGRNGNFGLVPPCSRSAAWSSWFCRLYCTAHSSWISTSVYFDSLNQTSWPYLQFEAVWRKAIQKAFVACFAGTSADRSRKYHAILASVAHKQQQQITAFPHGSKLHFCSCSQEWHHFVCHHIKQRHYNEPHSSAELSYQPCKRKT